MLLSCTPVPFFTFFVGIISVNNLIEKLNTLDNMNNIKLFTFRWAEAILGSGSTCNGQELPIQNPFNSYRFQA